jgi:Flavodoxin domain
MTATAITVAYGSRFGSTAKLAEEIAAGLRDVGAIPRLIDVAEKGPLASQPMIVLSAIIWDRPVPVMREWITANRHLVRQWTVGCGVVCGSARLRETGGLAYARQLARRIGRPDVFQFALSGEIPSRSRLRSWEWWALQAFAAMRRKPQLFRICVDGAKANEVGRKIGRTHLLLS